MGITRVLAVLALGLATSTHSCNLGAAGTDPLVRSVNALLSDGRLEIGAFVLGEALKEGQKGNAVYADGTVSACATTTGDRAVSIVVEDDRRSAPGLASVVTVVRPDIVRTDAEGCATSTDPRLEDFVAAIVTRSKATVLAELAREGYVEVTDPLVWRFGDRIRFSGEAGAWSRSIELPGVTETFDRTVYVRIGWLGDEIAFLSISFLETT